MMKAETTLNALGFQIAYRQAPNPGGTVVLVQNQDGTIVARLLKDRVGIVCDCGWPREEGACMHILAVQAIKTEREN